MKNIIANFKLQLGDFNLDANFEAPANGITAIFGSSGSGKTSLLRCVAGLNHARGHFSIGETCWQDDKLKKFTPTHKRKLSYVFQERGLFSHLNVIENLNYGYKEKIKNHSKPQLNFDEVVSIMEIDSLLHRATTKLSGGERQRVQIARALLGRPEMILMDEPLASLDHESSVLIQQHLIKLKQKLAYPILYISHSAEELIRLADFLLLIEKGKITHSGKPNNLIQQLNSTLDSENGAGVIIKTTILHYNPEYKLTKVDFNGTEFLIPSNLGKTGEQVLIKILAKNVSLSKTNNTDSSILNIVKAKIIALQPSDNASINVELSCAGTQLLAMITKLSAQRLSLSVGDDIFAQIKSVNLHR